MVITLLAILVLVGLLLFVMNIGDHSSRRASVQDAADSAGLSGAIHMARSMNTVAMNNIAMSRMLALVLVYDSQPANVALSLRQAEALLERMEGQLPNAGPGGPMRQPTLDAETNIRNELAAERDILIPADDLFNQGGIDVTLSTTYRLGAGGETPHGSFWVAARHVDQFNRATVQTAGLCAQANAAAYARESLAEEGFVVPVLPRLPAIRGQWRDWYRDPGQRDTLLVHGWIPDLGFGPERRRRWRDREPYTDEQIEALLRHVGPFARLYGFRDPYWEWTTISDEEYASAPGGGGSWPWEREGAVTRGDLMGYTTFGPVGWMRRRINDYWRDDLKYSVPHYTPRGRRLDRIFHDLMDTKLRYMFEPRFVGTDQAELEMRHDPDWEVSWQAARRRDEEDGEEAELTVHFRMAIIGPYGPTDSRVQQTAKDTRASNVHDPRQVIEGGWHNREKETAHTGITLKVRIKPSSRIAGVPSEFDIHVGVSLSKPWGARITDFIWHADFSPTEFREKLQQMKDRQVWHIIRDKFPALEEKYPAEEYPGRPVTYDYSMTSDPPWVIMRDIFGGADFGTEQPIHNPANFNAGEMADLPMPYLMDTRDGEYDVWRQHHDDDPVRREHFTYLGVARRSSWPTAWPQRFGSGNPSGRMVAVAQAEIYNPTSWDLWTQDWRAQLVPVTRLPEWAERMGEAFDAPVEGGGTEVDAVADIVVTDKLIEILEYLELFDESVSDRAVRH